MLPPVGTGMGELHAWGRGLRGQQRVAVLRFFWRTLTWARREHALLVEQGKDVLMMWLNDVLHMTKKESGCVFHSCGTSRLLRAPGTGCCQKLRFLAKGVQVGYRT